MSYDDAFDAFELKEADAAYQNISMSNEDDTEFFDESYLQALTPAQRRGATTDGPVLVLAGAGTGKTTTLTAGAVWRCRHQGVSPSRLLVVTFTNKAASEMRKRIESILEGEAPEWMGTFHGLALRMLRLHPEIAGVRQRFNVADETESMTCLRKVLDDLNIVFKGEEVQYRHTRLNESLMEKIGQMKDDMTPPSLAPAYCEKQAASIEATETDDAALMEQCDDWRRVASVYASYQTMMRDENTVDFGDLLLWTTYQMQEDENYRRFWSQKFDCVMADEYQDVNFVQWKWLKLLAQDHQRIFVVGDDDQAIYSWRGSKIEYIRNFVNEYENATTITIEQNFRSTGHIIGAANDVISKDDKRLDKTLFTGKGDGHSVVIGKYATDYKESEDIVADIVRRQQSGTNLSDIAIIYRYNHIRYGFEAEMARNRIPYEIVGGYAFFERAEVQDMVAFLKLAVYFEEKQSNQAFRRVANVPKRGLGDKAMLAITNEAKTRNCSLMEAAKTAPLTKSVRAQIDPFIATIEAIAQKKEYLDHKEMLEALFMAVGYNRYLEIMQEKDNKDRKPFIDILLEVAEQCPTVDDFFDSVSLDVKKQANSDEGCVKLMTIHASKGLEFKEVFLPGWEKAKTNKDVTPLQEEEERRLAYVAITRAKERCTISYALERHRAEVSPIRFLSDISNDNKVIKNDKRQDNRGYSPTMVFY